MFEKEAEDFLKKSLKVDDDEFDFFKNEASCKEKIKSLYSLVCPIKRLLKIYSNFSTINLPFTFWYNLNLYLYNKIGDNLS